MTEKKTTVSLVLGSGGARGLTHIGIIRYLEENGYQITSVAGSSMGALVGGIYAAGKLKEYTAWVRGITKLDILRLLDISLVGGGFVKGDKIIGTLRELIGDRLIEDLPIPFTAVASNIVNGKEVWLSKGPLFDAIRASIAIPLFFTPFELNGEELLDGGILNPVPIAPTFKDNTDLTIAVNLGAQPDEAYERKEEKIQDDDSPLSFIQKTIKGFIENLQDEPRQKPQIKLDMYDIINQSLDAMQGTIARQKLAAYPPDILIDIPRNICGTLEFDRADEMIDYGYQRAKEVL
ncbi:MAG TPA: serine protease [Caldithrix abyssi]|uniref:Serine protease n=1 Tax=Caldithrix abyssi TaxID=187145 RepID=A0A7V4TZW5_CALAY|nr:serine protease [Caldithrix abyssi]